MQVCSIDMKKIIMVMLSYLWASARENLSLRISLLEIIIYKIVTSDVSIF